MTRGVRWIFVGIFVLVALAGCGRSYLQFAEREPWRRDAELACLNSGTVKEGAGVVRIEPIDGPGVCGAAFPLKIVALGGSSVLGYADEPLRPPGSIPGASRAVPQPRWPIAEPQYRAPAQRYSPPVQTGSPMSIQAPGTEPVANARQYYEPPPQYLGAPPSELQSAPRYRLVPTRPANPPIAADNDEEELPPYARPGAAPLGPAVRERPLPRLGPPRGPRLASAPPVEVKPTATLACPVVSALDQWIVNAVQPAAQKWFGRPVVEIKQISAYSCRGMNGQPGARISEHAFGNALDIAAFVLADGHRITVKNGWRGSPEEQGFLRDVQGAACDQFTTVLAPGSNSFHYDHIHVDLMRRASGRRICQPGAVDGELIAARARKNPVLASRRPEPPPTRRYDPPIDSRNDPFAWRGDIRRGDPATTGSVGRRRPTATSLAEDDNDWVEEPGKRPAIEWGVDRHKMY